MGKSKKKSRKRSPSSSDCEALDQLRRKLKKIERKIESRRSRSRSRRAETRDRTPRGSARDPPESSRSGRSRSSSSSSGSTSSNSRRNSSDESEKPSVPRRDRVDDDVLIIEAPMDPDLLEIMTDTSCKQDLKGPALHSVIQGQWAILLSEGLTEDNRKGLLEKFPMPSNLPTLSAPTVNPEILAMLSKDHKQAAKRDEFLSRDQNQLSTAITAIGGVVTTLMATLPEQGEERKSRLEAISGLTDSTKLLLDLHHTMSLTRRSFITPHMDFLSKTVADKSPVDQMLYGEGFSDRIKSAQALAKTGDELSRSKPKPMVKPSYSGGAKGKPTTGSLNGRRPPNRKYTSGRGGRRYSPDHRRRYSPDSRRRYSPDRRHPNTHDQRRLKK